MAKRFFSQYDMVLTKNDILPVARVERSEADQIQSTIATRNGFITIQTGPHNGTRVRAEHIVAFIGVKGEELPDHVPHTERAAPDTATCKHPEDKRTIYKKGEPPRYFRVCDVCGYRMGPVHKSHVEDPDTVPELVGKE